MGRKRRPDNWEDDQDTLSEELEDILEESVRLIDHKRLKVETQSWVDKYAPSSSTEVCINPRKLKDVRMALEDMVSGNLKCRLLILSGPSGSSKSTIVKCLAKEIVPKRQGSDPFIEYSDSFVDETPLPLQFGEFLASCRYHIGSNLAVILVEELPNIFHEETHTNFQKALYEWIFMSSDVPLPPLVLCLTELDSISEQDQVRTYNIEHTLTVETLLGRNLLYSASFESKIKRIKFLPLAKTFIFKIIDLIATSEHLGLSKRSNTFFQSLCESGDIRSLINNLEFWARARKVACQPALDVFSRRETQISLFHAIGKVIHSSSDFREEDLNFADFQSVKCVVDNYYNLSLLQFGLLENYHTYNGLDYDVSIAAGITDGLSLWDSFSDAPEFKEFGLLATRSELRKVTAQPSRAFQIMFPRHFQLQKKENRVKAELCGYRRYLQQMRILSDDANLVDGCLVPLIFNSHRYKMTHDISKKKYNRIGGKFMKLFSKEALSVVENDNEMERSSEDQFQMDISAIASREEQEKLSELNEELSDAIEQSSQDDDFNDTLDERLLAMTESKTHSQSRKDVTRDDADNESTNDGMHDDPEIELLVSKGVL